IEDVSAGSLPLIQGTIKLLDDYSSASEREKELLRIAKEALKELLELELQRKGTTDCNKVLREVTEETTAAEVWSKLETLYMTKSLANKLYLKKKLYTFYMQAERKISEHVDEFNKIVLDLANIKVKFEDEDLALLLLTCLPASYEYFVDTLLYGREALALEDVMATLNSKKIKERFKAKGMMVKGYIVQLGDNTECKIRGINKSGKVKVINGSRVVLSGIRRDNYVYSLDGHAMIGELNASVEEKDSLAQAHYSGNDKLCSFRLKKPRTDNGFEFYNWEFEKPCIESGIARHLAVARTPQQNGLAERMNRTLMDKVRYLLIQSGLPRTIWAEVTWTAAYLINRSPSRAIKKKTHMEMWSGHPSDIRMLRIFDCVAYPQDKQGTWLVTMVFKESVMYKDTLKNSGAGADKSVEELQVGVELQRLNNHTPEEDHTDQEDGADEDARDQETDQTPDLTNYQLARDRERRTRTKPLSCKWLVKIKEGIEGVQKPRYKARLVARGFTLRVCIDYNEVFSLVVRHTSIRVILTLTACKDYELEQLDVKTEFLHGNLEEVIYMRQPPGYEQGNKVCLLKKSRYGLKRSPRQWYRRFDEYMLSNGFKRSDDMLIACKSKAEIGSTKSVLKKEFDMKELGEAKKILDNGKSVKMPLGGHFKLSLKDCPVRDCNIERMSKVPYANVVGSLMYLMVCTRPDITYVVSVVSRYLANLGKNHWEAVKWILKYLRGTANVGLVYGTNHGNHVDVAGFVNSDYAKDPDKGRSITSYAFLVQGCVVGWKATLQHVVALSTIEAEYMALTEAVKEAIWLRGLLEELDVELNTVAVTVIIRARFTYRGIMFFMKGLSTSMCVITLSERSWKQRRLKF
ncbi:retrovirus-related pol polyprotein from transposon TNT 1-94, partial [Tanacetum coccineum]